MVYSVATHASQDISTTTRTTAAAASTAAIPVDAAASASRIYGPLINVLVQQSQLNVKPNPPSPTIDTSQQHAAMARSTTNTNLSRRSSILPSQSASLSSSAFHMRSRSSVISPSPPLQQAAAGHPTRHPSLSIRQPPRSISRGSVAHQQPHSPEILESTSSVLTPFATPLLTQSMFDDMPELVSYFDHLTTSSLEAVRREPEHLAAEQARLSRQLSTVAFSEYRSFLRAHASCNDIRKGLTNVSTEIPKLTSTVSSLKQSLMALSDSAQNISGDHHTLLLVLAQHEYLIEVLDIPKLFDTFISGGYYEEAMDLRIHVQRLPERYPNLSVVAQIAQQVDVSAEMMLGQLIMLLRGDIKLPLCIRVIGYLRRMGSFAESELRLVFLQQRDVFLTSRLAAIDGRVAAAGCSSKSKNAQSSPVSNQNDSNSHDVWVPSRVEYLKRYIEISRELFFDIVTQYKAIFTDSQVVFSSSESTSALSPTSVAGESTPGISTDHYSSSSLVFDASAAYSTQSILSSYVTHTIGKFISVLRTHLDIPSSATLNQNGERVASTDTESIPPSAVRHGGSSHLPLLTDAPPIDEVAAINSVLTQTMYYGMSLGRIGIDFRQAVSGVFEPAVERVVKTQLAHGVDAYISWAIRTRLTGIYAVSIMGTNSSHGSSRKSSVGLGSIGGLPRSTTESPSGSGIQRSSSQNGSIQQPPLTLLSYPPLGTLLNVFLGAFNQLRLLPCLSLVRVLSEFISTSLVLITHTTSELATADWPLWSDARRNEFEEFCRVFCAVFVPYIIHAFEEGVYNGFIGASDDERRIDCRLVCKNLESWANAARRRAAVPVCTSEPSDATDTLAPIAVSPISSELSGNAIPMSSPHDVINTTADASGDDTSGVETSLAETNVIQDETVTLE
ncbi:hypothetical protein BASA61_004609 [Batrachochytrium salamandrivorans]|nr:hypothetical protein BASA61_004609 [Batrachochytrium salamandrivorans]